jgi:hypothetical protein
MDPEQVRQAKQTFLTKSIIDQGYDAESFINFCERQKSSDIDEWSLDELQACVENFTNPQRKFSNADIIECRQIRPTALNSEVVQIMITRPEKKSGTFSSKCFFYYVLTLPLGWSVQRKITDFIWLGEVLSNEYPGLFIPVIKEKSNKKLEDPLELDIQVRQLSYFMQYLANSDLLKRSPSLIAFLQEENREKFSKVKKIKIKKPSEVKQFPSADGKLLCEYDNFQDLSLKINNFCDLSKDSLKKLSHESKNLKRIMNELCLSLNTFTSLFNEMSGVSAGVAKNARPLKELYAKLADVTSKTSEKVWNLNVKTYEFFHGTFKFFKGQGAVLKNLVKEKEAFFSEAENLRKKIAKIAEKDKGVKKETTDKLKEIKFKAAVFNYFCKEQNDKAAFFYVRNIFDQSLEFCVNCSKEVTGILTIFNSLQDVIEASKSLLVLG